MRMNDVLAKQIDEGPITDKLKALGNAAINKAPAGMLGGAARLANKLGAKGTAQNLSGRTTLSLTSKNLSNQLQNYLGTKGMSLSSLTPAELAKFLTTKGVDIRSSDISANATGTVDRATIGTILRDVSSKSLAGEPVIYRKKSSNPMGAESPAVRAYKAKKSAQQSAADFKGYNKSNIPAAAQSTGAENYVQSWANDIMNAKRPQYKINLARELVNFLADRAGSPEGARGAQQALATMKRVDMDPRIAKNVVTALKKGRRLSPSMRLEKTDYDSLLTILEMTQLTLKDIGLWRVLKESTESYVVLRER